MTDKDKQQQLEPMPEQIGYANILFIGAWSGIVIMAVSYILYVSGILEPHIDIALVTENWGKGVHEFMKITNSPDGWSWLYLLGKGDYLTFIGVALLAVLTIFCYLFLVVGYARTKDWIYFTICVLEICVLSLAASGILGAGGH